MSPDLGRDPFDPYRELQLAPGAEPELVKAAFKALAKKHHPDRFTDPQEKARAEERMKRLNEAQRLLTEGGYRPARPDSTPNPPTSPVAPPPSVRTGASSYHSRSTPSAPKPKRPLSVHLNFGIFALLLISLIVFLLAGPTLSRHYQSKAASLLDEQRLEEALEQADRALHHDDRNAEAYLLRADIYERLGEPEKAEVDRRNGRGLLPSSKPIQNVDPSPTPSLGSPPKGGA